ncbi:pumilio homolog 15 [Phtheirospermum japonicum]|uniref:Pumilio homolog 15 n=1 Tax=Phtheirospermum japonicum TaxID=374723 RepID=A0A830BGX7_9LAMI|nr:pumilio homolog 15 [Phtheirospermum japonicum]
MASIFREGASHSAKRYSQGKHNDSLLVVRKRFRNASTFLRGQLPVAFQSELLAHDKVYVRIYDQTRAWAVWCLHGWGGPILPSILFLEGTKEWAMLAGERSAGQRAI